MIIYVSNVLSLYILCMLFVIMLLYLLYNINEILMDKLYLLYLGFDLKLNFLD